MSDMQTPKRLLGSPMENNIQLPPPPSGISNVDFLYQSSRKRTFTAMSQQGIAGESSLDNGFTRESDQQHRTGYLSRNNVEETSLGFFSSKEFQFHSQNNFPEKVHNSGVNSHNLSVQPQSFHHGGCSLPGKVSDGETLWPSNYQPKAYNVWPTGENKALPVLKSSNACAVEAEIGSSSQDVTSLSHGGMGNQPLGACSSSSKSLKSLGVQEQNLINPGRQVDFDEKTESPEAIKYSTKQSGHDANSIGISGISTVGSSSSGELCTIDNQRSLQHGIQVNADSFNIVSDANCKGRDHGDGSVQLLKKKDGLGAGSSKQALAVAASPRNHDSSVNVDCEHSKNNSQYHDSIHSNEKVRPVAGKVGLAVAEKLWNGSLQLNSSVTISAVAFFKSGEKIPDINWSESVEVKGKVRLEAFEKYIQDLPRSRNRGLMVISLRLKDGSSSEAELARMKEVAKGYKEGKKVGFAQLSPGSDLYICPRSDAIITILAKHGFFKGKAAIEDDHDSLIGCVVWRRKRALSSSDTKKPEKKNSSAVSVRPPSSPSDSEKNLPRAEPVSKSTAASTVNCTTSMNSIEARVITCSQAQLDSCSSSTMDSLPVSAFPCSSSSSTGLQASPCAGSHSVLSPIRQSLKAGAPFMAYSGPEKPKPSLEVKKPVFHLPSDVVNGRSSIYDDDDLPEYDFGVASCISHTTRSKLPSVTLVDDKLSNGGSGRRDGLPLTMSTEQKLPIFNQRRLENLNLPRLPADAIEKMSPVRTACDRDQIPGLPLSEEKHNVQSGARVGARTAPVPQSKSMFDDDDDIPEWCPPDMELHKKPLPEMIQASSTISTPSVAPKLPMEHLYPPRPPYPPPAPFYSNPPLPTQPRPHTAIPVNKPQPEPFQKRPSPSVKAIWPSVLPINPVWRNWRP